jgi:hypothetical protein
LRGKISPEGKLNGNDPIFHLTWEKPYILSLMSA